MKNVLLIPIVMLGNVVLAINPIIEEKFTADPAAMVYNDTVYLYTGHDEASGNEGYRMYNWQCFTTTDMVNWTDHGEVLNVSEFSWAKGDAWAGEVEEKNGKFYFYICAEHSTVPGKAIGVAMADNPKGPFKDALGYALITNNMTTDIDISWDDIDPTVFVDDDGQAYLYWGNSLCYYVKLKENMIEIEGNIQKVDLPSFTEASYLHKHNDTYYLSYAYGWPEKIAYATSDSATGPWTFQKIINNNVNNCGTNHQSIIEYKGQSYFIYHTGDIGGDYQRSVAVEYLFYNEDGSIKDIVQTSQSVDEADTSCQASSVDRNIKQNNKNWSNNRYLSLFEGDSVTFSFETQAEGSWEWTGPNDHNGTDSTSVIKNVTTEQSGEYLLTYTNNCGTKTYIDYNIMIYPKIPDDIKTGKEYIIKQKESDLVISVQEDETDDGANIYQLENSYKNSQRWKFIMIDLNGFWRISPMNDLSKGMDVDNVSTVDGANIIIWDYWGGENQQWIFIAKDDDYYQIKARHSNKCLEVDGGPQVIRATLSQWSCVDKQSQLFSIEEFKANSVFDLDDNDVFNIYPNPVYSNNFVLDFSNIDHPGNVKFFDMKGLIVFQTNFTKNELLKPDIELKNGIYIVKVNSGELSINKRLIVNKVIR